MKRLAITGSSGYLGTALIEQARRQGGFEILGIDIRRPAPGAPRPDRFVEMDVVSTELGGVIGGFEPDAVVHAAYVMAPIHDRRRTRSVNVDGSRNAFEAAAACGAGRLMFVSSATAYGAWPDNPVPMDEDWPLRPARFQYAAEKVEVEGMAAEFANRHPGMAVTRVRPAIIGGPRMDNYVYRFIFKLPVLALLDGCDTPVQFVHEEDVAAAMLAILAAGARGGFNIGPADWCTVSEIAAATGRRAAYLPFGIARAIHGLGWALRLPPTESPPEFLDFARHPWVVAPRRLERELGFRFGHGSRDTLLEIVRSRSVQAGLMSAR